MRLHEIIDNPLACTDTRLRRSSWVSDRVVVVDKDGWLRNGNKEGSLFQLGLGGILSDDWEILPPFNIEKMENGTRFFSGGGTECIKLPDGIYYLTRQGIVTPQSLGYPSKCPTTSG